MPTDKPSNSPDMSGEAADITAQPFHGSEDNSQKAEQEPFRQFPIVGIGASAGGLAAFEAFFTSMPANVEPGMAFVLVQHLAPDHKSILTDLIRRYTCMQVFEVEDGMAVKPNCAYIIPPNCDMALLNGVLQLLEPSAPRGQRLPIDFFFRSLAQDQHEHAICIILSGTGSDGSLGARAIKGEGGLVIAQDPDTIQYNGMPRSAVATGVVDYVLAVADIPRKLMEYVAHALGTKNRATALLAPRTENAMKKIFIMLRAHTGNDFSQYKPNTIYRRIERRMAIQQIEAIDEYVKYLQQSPAEVEELFRDLLIGVTSFFRDPEAFMALKNAIPQLLANRHEGATIRAWSACCSTGEEAYSLAILLQEYIEQKKLNCTVQIFATDIDKNAIATARAGVYPVSAAADIAPERLARFFTLQPDGSSYRIHKTIRDMLIFSEHNITKDPPFSKLDLISCRNFLIYLGKDMQKKLIKLFHYSLNPGGLVFLGNSENVSESDDLFVVLDRKARLFQKRVDFINTRQRSGDWFFPITMAATEMVSNAAGKAAFPMNLTLREITERALLQQDELAGVLVNGRGDILYLHGRTGMYLELNPGESEVNNILKMSREGLKHELTTALHKATGGEGVVRCLGLRVKTNGHFTRVNLSVRPVSNARIGVYGEPLFLVILEKAPQSDQVIYDQSSINADQTADEDGRIESLRQQLRAKEDYLQAANEELETANEELSSSNEEMQSINEELQSTNEELETSREELQSINEELTTVNAELQTKVIDLSQLNNDMNNMLSGTGIGTVFVDLQLRILRFTPTATEIINLIQSDVGRPVAHIVSNLVGYDSLVADVQTVLRTLVFKESEVQTSEGKWYKLRIQPYRTSDNVIEGAVITFVDITQMIQVKDALTVSEIRFRRLFETAKDGMLILDAESGRVANVNQYLVDLLGYSEEQFTKKAIWELGFLKDVIANRDKFLELQQREYIRYDDLPLETADGRLIDVEFISSVYQADNHKVIQCAIRVIGDHQRA